MDAQGDHGKSGRSEDLACSDDWAVGGGEGEDAAALTSPSVEVPCAGVPLRAGVAKADVSGANTSMTSETEGLLPGCLCVQSRMSWGMKDGQSWRGASGWAAEKGGSGSM